MGQPLENHSETLGKQCFGPRSAQVRFKLGSSTQLRLGWTQVSAAAGHGDAEDALGARGAGGVPPSLPAEPPETERDNGHRLAIHWQLIDRMQTIGYRRRNINRKTIGES